MFIILIYFISRFTSILALRFFQQLSSSLWLILSFFLYRYFLHSNFWAIFFCGIEFLFSFFMYNFDSKNTKIKINDDEFKIIKNSLNIEWCLINLNKKILKNSVNFVQFCIEKKIINSYKEIKNIINNIFLPDSITYFLSQYEIHVHIEELQDGFLLYLQEHKPFTTYDVKNAIEILPMPVRIIKNNQVLYENKLSNLFKGKEIETSLEFNSLYSFNNEIYKQSELKNENYKFEIFNPILTLNEFYTIEKLFLNKEIFFELPVSFLVLNKSADIIFLSEKCKILFDLHENILHIIDFLYYIKEKILLNDNFELFKLKLLGKIKENQQYEELIFFNNNQMFFLQFSPQKEFSYLYFIEVSNLKELIKTESYLTILEKNIMNFTSDYFIIFYQEIVKKTNFPYFIKSKELKESVIKKLNLINIKYKEFRIENHEIFLIKKTQEDNFLNLQRQIKNTFEQLFLSTNQTDEEKKKIIYLNERISNEFDYLMIDNFLLKSDKIQKFNIKEICEETLKFLNTIFICHNFSYIFEDLFVYMNKKFFITILKKFLFISFDYSLSEKILSYRIENNNLILELSGLKNFIYSHDYFLTIITSSNNISILRCEFQLIELD